MVLISTTLQAKSDFMFIWWQEARESRLFGTVPMTEIVGGVVYALRSAVDHGPVQNRYSWTINYCYFISVSVSIDFLFFKKCYVII